MKMVHYGNDLTNPLAGSSALKYGLFQTSDAFCLLVK